MQIHINKLLIGRYLAQITQLFTIQKEKFCGLAVLFVVQQIKEVICPFSHIIIQFGIIVDLLVDGDEINKS